MTDNIFQWFSPKPAATKPVPLPLEDRKIQACQEALIYLQDRDLDATNLAALLRARHNITPEDAIRAVEDAQAVIAEGNGEDK